jgi:hypothetical protein
LGIIAGQIGPNRYGPDPLSRATAPDIRAMSSLWPWRRFATIGLGLFALLGVSLLVYTFGFANAIGRIRLLMSSPVPGSEKVDDFWGDKPGEWVMFEYGIQTAGAPSIAHFFKPSSVRIIGDRVAFEGRYPGPIKNEAAADKSTKGSYEVITNVIDCKKSLSAIAEKNGYNKAREVISKFKWGDPESLDLAIGISITQGSIAAAAQHILCNEEMRSPLLSKEQLVNISLKYLTRTNTGDGDVFYGPTKSTYESIGLIKYDVDYPFSMIFSSDTTIMGLPASRVRYRGYHVRFKCADRKIEALKTEHYDSNGNLVHIFAPVAVKPVDVPQGSPLEMMFSVVCGPLVPKVQGTYEGTNYVTYANKGQVEQKISVFVEQMQSELNITFEGPNSGQSKGTGKLISAKVEAILLQSTAPKCPGSYDASLEFAVDTLSWSFKGQDCGGQMEGRGTARRTKS